jgi:hypothetical protein
LDGVTLQIVQFPRQHFSVCNSVRIDIVIVMTPHFDGVWNLVASIAAGAWNAAKASGPLWTALAGVFIGAWLTRSREQAAWLRNCEKEEWKELYSALSKSELVLASLMANHVSGTQEQRQKAFDNFTTTSRDTNVILRNRFFTHSILQQSGLIPQWWTVRQHILNAVLNNTLTQDNLNTLGNEFDRIQSEIRRMALASMTTQTTFHGLLFWKH